MSEIQGYEGLYDVFPDGTIWSRKTHRFLSPRRSPNGYMRVMLYKDGVPKSFSVHRLVGLAFVENPLGKEQINHKDGNKENNNVENLEWVSARENLLHRREVLHKAYTSNKPVKCLETGRIYGSQTEAAISEGVNRAALNMVLSGKRKSTQNKTFILWR